MSCSPRHRKWCSRWHEELVCGYRDARDAREALRESDVLAPASFGYGAHVSAMQLEDDDFDAAYPPVTFRQWLLEHAGLNRPPEPWAVS